REDAFRLAPHTGAGAPHGGHVDGSQTGRGAQGPARKKGRRGLPGVVAPAARSGLRGAAAGRSVSARLETPAAPPPESSRGARALAPLAVSSGEPAGIGPDICLALAASELAPRVVVLGDRSMLEARARQLGIRVKLRGYGSAAEAGPLECLHFPLGYTCRPGSLDPRGAPYVLALLDRAVAGCMTGEFAALVTAPVHKGAINDGGIPFIGHTEYLAERTGTA